MVQVTDTRWFTSSDSYLSGIKTKHLSLLSCAYLIKHVPDSRPVPLNAEQANTFNDNKTVACSGSLQRKDSDSKSDIRRADD